MFVGLCVGSNNFPKYVYHTPLSSTLSKLALYKWDTPMMRFCTLFPFCWCELHGNLFAITHPAITSWCQPKIHLFVGTLLRSHTRSAFVLHSYFHLHLWMMGNTICMALQAEEAFLTITRLEHTCLNVARSLARYSIPVKADAIVEKRYPKINLEIMATLIFVPVFLPLRLSNTLLSKKCHNSVFSMNNPVQCPAKDPNVPPVSVDTL